MSLSISLIDSVQEIENKITSALVVQVNQLLSKNQGNLINKAKALVKQWIAAQPEIVSLKSSDSSSLAGLFGLTPPNADRAANVIIDAVVSSLNIKLVPYNKTFTTGGLEISFQPSDFSNLLSLQEGHTKIYNGDLHWLQWLLQRGDSIIITNYQYNPGTGLGRSGLGSMVQGGSFRVPPQFSGTDNNNFITRALIGPSQEKELTKLFKEIFG